MCAFVVGCVRLVTQCGNTIQFVVMKHGNMIRFEAMEHGNVISSIISAAVLILNMPLLTCTSENTDALKWMLKHPRENFKGITKKISKWLQSWECVLIIPHAH